MLYYLADRSSPLVIPGDHNDGNPNFSGKLPM